MRKITGSIADIWHASCAILPIMREKNIFKKQKDHFMIGIGEGDIGMEINFPQDQQNKPNKRYLTGYLKFYQKPSP